MTEKPMKRLSSLLSLSFLALSLGSFAQSEAQETPKKTVIVLKWVEPKVGDRFRELRDTSLSIKGALTINGTVARKIDQARALSADKTLKILALKEGQVTKATVSYKKQSLETKSAANAQPDKDTRLQGKSFTLEKKDGALNILDAKGNAVDSVIAELITAEEEPLFSKNHLAFVKAIVAKKWQFGDSLDLEKDVAASILGDKEQLKLDSVKAKLTLRRSRVIGKAPCLVFDVKISGKSDEYGTKTGLTMNGEVTIEEKTGRLRLLILKGPITVNQLTKNDAQTVIFKSAGRMTLYRKID